MAYLVLILLWPHLRGHLRDIFTKKSVSLYFLANKLLFLFLVYEWLDDYYLELHKSLFANFQLKKSPRSVIITKPMFWGLNSRSSVKKRRILNFGYAHNRMGTIAFVPFEKKMSLWNNYMLLYNQSPLFPNNYQVYTFQFLLM